MAQASDDAELPADDALDEIADMRGNRTALGRRTSGITWILWGFVATCLLLSYFVWVAMLLGELLPADMSAVLEALPWYLFVPWLVIGGVSTWALWHSVSLSIPGLSDTSPVRRAIQLTSLLAVGVAGPFALILLEPLLGVPLFEWSAMMLMLGTANLAAGVFGIACWDALEQKLVAASGLLLMTVALAGAIAGGADRLASFRLFSILAPATLLATYLGLGITLATRG